MNGFGNLKLRNHHYRIFTHNARMNHWVHCQKAQFKLKSFEGTSHYCNIRLKCHHHHLQRQICSYVPSAVRITGVVFGAVNLCAAFRYAV